jgi:hypothetical protein
LRGLQKNLTRLKPADTGTPAHPLRANRQTGGPANIVSPELSDSFDSH